MSMTPNATVKPWRKTIRGEKRTHNVRAYRRRTRGAPPRDLDQLTHDLIESTDRMLGRAT